MSDDMGLLNGQYFNDVSKLAEQWNQESYKERARERIYLKDIDYPQASRDKLQKIMRIR